jgi:DNA-binding LytR/AlgR family response regulator
VKMFRTVNGIKLKIPGYDEEVPVSRQYLLGVRSALEKHGL